MAQFQQLEVFQAAASSLFVPLRVNAPADAPFRAEVADASVGPISVTRIVSTPAQVLRLPRLIGSADRELVKVTLHRRGHLIVAQDGRQSRVSPGDLVAYESSRPYELVGQDRCDIIVLGVPRPMLGPSGDLISRRTALTLPSDRGIRSVIATFFSGLADRLLSYALASLHDPGLSAQSVAHRHGISVRYLHKLMRDRDIRFAAWVRRERMRRIRRDLLDPRLAHVTAAGIAARWGIQDPDHLGRSLRAEFGCGAAEIRACAGQLPSPGTSR
jgi:AraC-like DNA-binding protein